MMATKSRLSVWGLGLLVVLSTLPVLAGCTESEDASENETISVSMLVQIEDTDTRWFRDVTVPKGTNAWELTEKVTEGDYKANYFSAYRSHFVDAIFGVEGANPKFWLIYVWSEPESKWESLPVGADLYSLKDGHVLAWYYGDTSQITTPPVTPSIIVPPSVDW